jgi:hypothetical protein
VLLGPLAPVAEACRGLGVTTPFLGSTLKGCSLSVGDSHWIWAVQDDYLVDTLAHEIRHTHEGAWHP